MSELQNLCQSIREKYLDNEPGKTEKMELYVCQEKLKSFMFFSATPVSPQDEDLFFSLVEAVCKKERKVIKTLEEAVVKALLEYAERNVNTLEKAGLKRGALNRERLELLDNKKLKSKVATSLKIQSLAFVLLAIRKNRDSFSGTRRAIVTEILTALNTVYAIEGLVDIFIENLGYRGLRLLNDTVDCMKLYYGQSDEPVDEKIVAVLQKRADKAKQYSELVDCMRGLIKLGIISDYEARNRIEAWEKKNYMD